MEKLNRKEDDLDQKLNKRRLANGYRSLRLSNAELIDFSSNDYLGLARSSELQKLILEAYQQRSHTKNGSTGSRLLTGTTALLLETEARFALKFKAPAGLIFSSGYMANLAFFSTLPQKGDTLLYDELSHACIKDGARLGMARKFPFRHNDLDQLESKLKRAEGQVYIACESVYSMDGDTAPLADMAAMAKKYGARLVVDEAHSTGVFGTHGEGLVNELALQEQVFARIFTFGKAMGVHGAFLAGNEQLREYLINFSRPFIYTTAPSDLEVTAMASAVEMLEVQPQLIQQLHERISLFRALVPPQFPLIESRSAIQAVLVPGNEKVKKAAAQLQAKGFDIRPILSPTVKSGEERLRICLHAYNTEKEIRALTLALNDYLSDGR